MSQDRVLATYLIETPHSLEHAAAVIAGEQSSGTFVSVPGETSELKERFGAQVVRIDALDTVSEPSLPGSKAPRSDAGRTVYQRGRVVISFPFHNFGPSLSSLLATVAGNLYELQELSGIRLEDLELPQAFAQRYPRPGFRYRRHAQARSGVWPPAASGRSSSPASVCPPRRYASWCAIWHRPGLTSSRMTSCRPIRLMRLWLSELPERCARSSAWPTPPAGRRCMPSTLPATWTTCCTATTW